MTKQDLLIAGQDFINSYYGKQGNVDFSYYDKHKKFTFGIDEGFYGIAGKEIRINLQGTNEKLEWRGHETSNFNFFIKRIDLPSAEHFGKDNRIKVHKGHLGAYRQGRKKLLEMAKSYETIYIQGHSRGAAIGTIFARDVQWHIDNDWKSKQKVKLITAGAPRTYNYFGAKEFNSTKIESIRLVYRNDTVTRIPYNIFGYCHIGKLVWLGFPFILSPIGIPFDHYPTRYLEGIKKLKNGNY